MVTQLRLFSIYRRRTIHNDMFLRNVSKSSGDICVWHPENICWFMCISLSKFTTGESISLRNVCVYIGLSTVWGQMSVQTLLYLTGWISFCWSFCFRHIWFCAHCICMLPIFPIDLSITQELIYPQHTLIRLAQVCESERRGLGFGFYLLRLLTVTFSGLGFVKNVVDFVCTSLTVCRHLSFCLDLQLATCFMSQFLAGYI